MTSHDRATHSALIDILQSRRCNVGANGSSWDRTALPDDLRVPISRIDRCLHGLSGITRILHAASLATNDGEELGADITEQLQVAASELIDVAIQSMEQIGERYPERKAGLAIASGNR